MRNFANLNLGKRVLPPPPKSLAIMDHPQYGDLSSGQAAQMHFYADSDLMDLFTN